MSIWSWKLTINFVHNYRINLSQNNTQFWQKNNKVLDQNVSQQDKMFTGTIATKLKAIAIFVSTNINRKQECWLVIVETLVKNITYYKYFLIIFF